MKLVSTLPERPGFLHVVPFFNLFALLLAFFVLGPTFQTQNGVAVELPASRFQMERFAHPVVVTVRAGEPPVLFLGHEQVSLDLLGRRLEQEGKPSGESGRMAILRVDGLVPVEVERQVAEIALARGYRVALVGRPGRGGVEESGVAEVPVREEEHGR